MGAQKLTEVVLGSTPTEDTHFLITQPETVEGSKVEAVRRATAGNIKELMAGGLIAPKFSDQSTYTAGSYVLKNGVLYRFTATHSGAWTGTDTEVVTVGGEVERVVNKIDSVSSIIKGSYIARNTGVVSTSVNNYARTDLINAISVSFTGGDIYECTVLYYDETADINTGSGFINAEVYGAIGYVRIPLSIPYIAMSFRRKDTAALSDEDVTAIATALSIYSATDMSLTNVGKSADAKVTGDLIHSLVGSLNDITETKPIISDWTDYAGTGDTYTEGLSKINGYIRSGTGSYPGRISSNADYRVYYFKVTEDVIVYGTYNKITFRLRVSKEQPTTGNSQPFTGTLYEGDALPSVDNPVIVPAGMYVCFGSNASNAAVHLYWQPLVTKAILKDTTEPTTAMKSFTTDITDELNVKMHLKKDVIDVHWSSGYFSTTVGERIDGALSSNSARKSCPAMLFPYAVAVLCDNNYRMRITYADGNFIITRTGDFNAGVYVGIKPGEAFRVVIRNQSDTSISEISDEEIRNHIKIIGLYSNCGYRDEPIKWLAMGDSITEGWYSTIGAGGASNDTDATKTYASKVAMLNGWRLVNIGKGSTGWLDPVTEGDYTTSAFYLARNRDFSSFDLVTLAYGINDWKANLAVGSYQDDPIDEETPTTVMQAMRATIEAIMLSNPTCKIIVITPLNCVGYNYNYGSKSTNYGLGYRFSKSGTLEEFVQKMIEVCNYYGIQYIDQTHYSCINRENLLTMLPDGVHPSERAHDLLAQELSKKITF